MTDCSSIFAKLNTDKGVEGRTGKTSLISKIPQTRKCHFALIRFLKISLKMIINSAVAVVKTAPCTIQNHSGCATCSSANQKSERVLGLIAYSFPILSIRRISSCVSFSVRLESDARLVTSIFTEPLYTRLIKLFVSFSLHSCSDKSA